MAERRQDIAARLKELREIEGLSAEGMAKSLGVSPAEYAAWEAGQADVPASSLPDTPRRSETHPSRRPTGA